MGRGIKFWLAAWVVAVGCRGSQGPIVPVSGRVTLDGQPLANGRIFFQPLSELNDVTGSHGVTDAAGRFTLRITVTDQAGAFVGRHRVQITARQAGASNDDTLAAVNDPIPARYNSQSTLEFEVPPGGTSEAHFELTK